MPLKPAVEITLISSSLHKILMSYPEIQSVFITDMKGVQLCAAGEDHRNKAQMYNAYKLSVDQSDKMGLGRQRSAVYGYQSTQIVALNMGHMIVFIVALSNANTGMLLEMRNQLQPVAETLLELVPNLANIHMDD
ncbi:hypothetical protein L596_030704 [Steinernema carpocapsae]|uniref:Roadblock/LAMTOR2 domain-containing protein n=1 Tax=Steinernema carpocapsae TaxID=34508 RepID=A0A4U5LNH1_STECR|nr:hypothetical protein L596_030704 [Steinernema carpocapsae]